MKWYEFLQNNSGGSFVIDDKKGIGPVVWVQARDHKHANMLAEEKGLYFDEDGDCPCCGSRWESASDYDTQDAVKVSRKYDFNFHDTVYLHPTDGPIQRLKEKDATDES